MLPFTSEQFFQVFADYNRAVWPAQWILWLAGAGALSGALARRVSGTRVALGLLAALWLWMALAYHWTYFARINPAARLFAVVFVVAASLLAWRAVGRSPLLLAPRRSARDAVGLALAAFGLVVYPLLNPLLGHRFPAAPGFGLPCPTTLFTIGLLTLSKPRVDRILLLTPVAWSLVGASAALLLGVWQDLALAFAAAWGVWLLIRPRATRRFAHPTE
ncbi:MAG TPA: DUF6064 family protein [Thermoanaerobaculia bacterium]|nr:DUF6064 family protein [Thermoanaerobaculia bacterium]